MNALYDAVASILAKFSIQVTHVGESKYDLNELYNVDKVICRAEWFGTTWTCGVRDGRFVMVCSEPEILAEEISDNLCNIVMENIKAYGLSFDANTFKVAFASNGTFCLSEEALALLSQSLPCWTPTDFQKDGKWLNIIPRHSEELVEIIEDLGDKASVTQNGQSNKIAICETDCNEYVISVAEGKEKVVTRDSPEWISIGVAR